MSDTDGSAGGVRLRVAYMVGTFPALTETFILREIGALRRRGIDIVVLAIRRPSHAQAAAGALGADVPCLYARPDRLVRHAVTNIGFLITRPRRYLTALWTFLTRAAALRPRAALQLLYHFFAGVGFSRDLRRAGATYVHGHWASSTSMALAAHLVDDTPFSFTVHASDDLFVEPVFLVEKSACARFVVAESSYAQRYLDAVTDFRYAEKLHRVYNGLSLGETERLSANHQGASSRHSLDGKRPLILSVGTLVPQKGHATLIQVCARLKAQGHAFHCRIIGQGPRRDVLERLIEAHRLQGDVTLLGPLPLDRVYAELLEADVFAFLAEIGPSGSRDGFPTVVLEAMAAGLPVVSTTLVGIPEMVIDRLTGLLVPERDIDAATRALERLLESAELRRSMGLAGQARVRTLFNLDHSADKLAALLSGSPPAAVEGNSG